MALYFDKFPRIAYDIAGARRTNYQIITNIFARTKILADVLSNASAYYEYLVKDHEKPEILAEKIYGSPEAHWVIFLANNIIDPLNDWPLNESTFNKYIIAKYGSIAQAQTTYSHHEKVITREESFTGIVTETRFRVDEDELTTNLANSLSTVPYDTYENLTADQNYRVHNLENGRAVTEIIYRDLISNYDYELELNEIKRSIKIIKPEYYGQLVSEFENIMKTPLPTYMRRLY